MAAIGIEEVLEARIVSSPTTSSSVRNNFRLTSRSSTIASTTTLQGASAPRSGVSVSRAFAAAASAGDAQHEIRRADIDHRVLPVFFWASATVARAPRLGKQGGRVRAPSWLKATNGNRAQQRQSRDPNRGK